MSYRIERNLSRVLAILAVAGFGAVSVRAGDKPEKIQVSEPASSVDSTNLTRINPNALNSQAGEDAYLKPFKSFNGGNSLDAIFDLEPPLAYPQQNQAQSPGRRSLQNSDRRKNWAFSYLNDLSDQPSMDDLMGIQKTDPFGKEDSRLSLVEMYIQNSLNSRQNSANARKSAQDSNTRTANKVNGETSDFDPVASAFKGSDPFFKRMITGDAGEPVKPVADAGVFGASGGFAASPEEREQQRRLAAFRHELDPSYPLPKSDNPFNPIEAVRQSQLATAAAAPSSIFQHTSLNPAAGALDPTLKAFHSHVYDDPTATALGLPQKPAFTVDKPAPPQPTAQSVLSQIDPFSANAPKRKF